MTACFYPPRLAARVVTCRTLLLIRGAAVVAAPSAAVTHIFIDTCMSESQIAAFAAWAAAAPRAEAVKVEWITACMQQAPKRLVPTAPQRWQPPAAEVAPAAAAAPPAQAAQDAAQDAAQGAMDGGDGARGGGALYKVLGGRGRRKFKRTCGQNDPARALPPRPAETTSSEDTGLEAPGAGGESVEQQRRAQRRRRSSAGASADAPLPAEGEAVPLRRARKPGYACQPGEDDEVVLVPDLNRGLCAVYEGLVAMYSVFEARGASSACARASCAAGD
jgi:hypothetical protein